MNIRLLATLLAAALIGAAFGSTAADARSGLPPKQKFEVTYDASYNQSWYASGDQDSNWDFAEQCVVGFNARGHSTFGARTKKKVVSLPADARKGVVYGQVPTRAWVIREVDLGDRPPEGCGYGDYDELANGLDCNNAPQWDDWGSGNPPAYLNVIAGKGVVNTDVHREREKEHLAARLPFCPFLGTQEGDVGGTAKLPAKKLFSGKPVTVKGRAERDQLGPSTHQATGFSEYELTIRYLGKKR